MKTKTKHPVSIGYRYFIASPPLQHLIQYLQTRQLEESSTEKSAVIIDYTKGNNENFFFFEKQIMRIKHGNKSNNNCSKNSAK